MYLQKWAGQEGMAGRTGGDAWWGGHEGRGSDGSGALVAAGRSWQQGSCRRPAPAELAAVALGRAIAEGVAI